MTSIHTEYDYRGKGPCVTLSTRSNTYFLFPLEDGFNATKIQFAVEYYSANWRKPMIMNYTLNAGSNAISKPWKTSGKPIERE